ncbi:MAG: TIGR02099 family protein [Gammaproteobacteria bacterium]|nr:TIGR02099 family protein [Gammaproteobacteria bacterium]
MKLQACLHKLIYSISVFIVVVAVMMGLTRLALSSLNLFHQKIETAVQQILQQPISLGLIRGDWQGLYPGLVVYDIQLTTAHDEHPFIIQELRLSVDWPSSLSKRTLQLNGLIINGMSAFVERTTDGTIHVQGIIPQQSSFDALSAIFSLPNIHVNDSRLSWLAKGADVMELNNIGLSLHNHNHIHQMEVSFQPGKALASSVRMQMDLNGTIHDRGSWLGSVYVETEDLQPFYFLDSDNNASNHYFAKHLASWITIQDGQISRVLGQGIAEQDKVTGVFQWLRQGEGWLLDINGFIPMTPDENFVDHGLSLQATMDNADQMHYRMGMQGIDFSWLSQLMASTGLLPENIDDMVHGLALQGVVDDLQMDLSTNQEAVISGFDIDAQINAFSMHSWNKIPGVDGLDLLIKGDMETGTVSITGEGSSFDAPKIFRWPLVLDRVNGSLEWDYQDKVLTLLAEDFEVGNSHIQTKTRLHLAIPLDEKRAHMDMQVNYGNGDIEHVEPYLPAGIMPAGAVKWLDKALVSGRVTQGGMLFYGDLKDFPFHHNDGRLEVRFDVKDGILDYKKGWKDIHALQAEVLFLNQSMIIHGHKGTILGVQLSQVKVSIDNLKRAYLTVDGTATGSFDRMMRFVKESPVGGSYTSGVGGFNGVGDAQLNLRLGIPLALNSGDYRVNGDVDLEGNRLLLPDWDLSVDELKGRFSFDGSTLYARNLQGHLFGDPVQISMNALPQGEDIFTRIEIQGKVDVRKKVQQQAAFLINHSAGLSQWLLRMDMPTSTKTTGLPVELSLSSDLQGLSIDLPYPLSKKKDETGWLELKTRLSASGQSKMIDMSYNGLFSAQLELGGDNNAAAWKRLAIAFGEQPARVSDQYAITVSGELDYLNVSAWLTALERIDRSGQDISRSLFVDLNLAGMGVSQYHFNDTRVVIDQDDGWNIKLAGDDLSGIIRVPSLIDQQHPLLVKLDRMVLNPVATERTESDISEAIDLQPGDVPPTDIQVRKLYFRELLLGEFQCVLQQGDNALVMNDSVLSSDWLNMEMSGDWRVKDNISKTQLSMTIRDSSLEKLLHLFAIKNYVRNGDMTANIELNWNDTPQNFSIQAVNGELDLHVKKGRLLNVNTGMGKILGLLNFSTIPRRFTLDFDDFLREGFVFDRIKGHLSLWNGSAYTSNFVVDGPVAEIQLFGRTGLSDKDYDLNVTVRPHLSSSLPLLGIIAGGPGIGAALYLADKLFSSSFDGLNKLGDSEYTVTGNWDQPQVNRVEKKREGYGVNR